MAYELHNHFGFSRADAALRCRAFPLRECTVLPHTAVPLHVFEPRHRLMVNQCLQAGLPLAVCHPHKLIKPAKPAQDWTAALKAHQATGRPVTVFSADHSELVALLDDGRRQIQVGLAMMLDELNRE